MRVNPLMVLPPVIFLVLAGLFLWGMGRDNPNEIPSTLIGAAAPALPETGLPDKTQLTDELLRAPGVKLVNFWASWCPPCRQEHPTLMELSQRVPIYGINLKDGEGAALGFLAGAGDPFAAQATDLKGRAAIDWGVTAPPETFIIGDGGVVLYRFVGPLVGPDYTGRFLPELEKALAGN